jgi:hypothetical protein
MTNIKKNGNTVSDADAKLLEKMIREAEKKTKGIMEATGVKPKKMNMGGVMTGRGGSFKGTR